MNIELFFENKFKEIKDNSEYKESIEFLLPITIKIKLVEDFIPADDIALEICNVNAKRIKISVSILFESKILFFSALIERDKIFFKCDAPSIKLLDTAWNLILGYVFLKLSMNLISTIFWPETIYTWAIFSKLS